MSERSTSEHHYVIAHDSGNVDPVALDGVISARNLLELARSWLSFVGAQIPYVAAGYVLWLDPADRTYKVAATWPTSLVDITHMQPAAEQALKEQREVLRCTADHAADNASVLTGLSQIAYPIKHAAEVRGVVVLALEAVDRAELQRALVALQWGGAWFTSVLLREALAAIEPHTQHAALALDLVHVALEQEDLQETALALVNALATRRGLRRASIGVIRHGQVKLLVVSHAAHTPTKANAALILQAAMEEALDQCATVCYPLGERADRPALHITLAHAELLEQGDAVGVISAILMQTGQPFGVLSCEYATGRFEPDAETPVIEAIAGLLGPALAQQLQLDAWVSGKLRRKTRQFWTHLFGPYHAKLKLLALAAVATLGFLLLAAGEFRISARTVLEGQIQRAAVAPFDGYIDTALVRAGDRVRKGQVLATLDEHDLALEQVRWRAERDQADRKLKTARADHDRAAVAVLDAQLAQAAAELALVDKKLARTKILAPFDGIVVAGDLSQQLGSPVDTGKALFEIATIDRYRAVLKVDERDVSHLALGQRGHLVLNGLATRPVAITVERMTAIATAEEGANVFRVEASLEPGAIPGLQPGMEGIAKIEIGERGLWWIWTRRLSDWVRVQFWTWWP